MPNGTATGRILFAAVGVALLHLPMNALAESPFLLETASGRISALRYRGDSSPTNYLGEDARLGDLHVAYRVGSDPWTRTDTSNFEGLEGILDGRLSLRSTLRPEGDRLRWEIRLKNVGKEALEVGSLALPLPMNTRFDRGPKERVMKHSFVSGAGSFLFWMRPNSVGPYLLMTCGDGTSVEYWNHHDGPYRVYIHSAAEKETIQKNKGSWRLPQSSRTLAPGETAAYALVLRWANDYQAVRDLLAKNGQVDVQVAPGMTVPNDLFADVAIRSTQPIRELVPEHPSQTEVKDLGWRGGYRRYRIRFSKLGENLVTVRHGKGRQTYLEFFSTEPVETLIRKRGAFLAKSQHHDPAKWYRGLISDWNMETQILLGPDNYDRITGWRIYAVTCDDPGLAKPTFLAAKNAEHPVQQEVDALDETIEHFFWGGLQQTTDEPYPYSIYGIPDWKTLRESPDPGSKGRTHLWRCYDYPHVILLYHSMYRIASQNPGVRTQLSAKEYLRRAFGTAVAMFTVPDNVAQWSPYFTGYYNELVIPEVVQDLERSGMKDEAAVLRGYWDKKAQTFVKGEVDLFGSEYPFDSTGFESSHALAIYALENQERLGITEQEADSFLHRQMAANLFCRGVLEPAYYLLGSDYRGSGGNAYTLSYMSQMGGWSVMDYALRHTSDRPTYLRLGYQSILSSWALMNTGTAKSNYGYWYPGKGNDGGAGGGFEPASYGTTWLEQPHGRGSWYYGCEIDLGYCGYLRAARTVVADDPIFGRFCFGGTGRSAGGTYRFVVRDGVRRRLSVRTAKTEVDLEMEGLRLSAEQEQVLVEGRSLTLRLEAPPLDGGRIRIENPSLRTWTVLADGKMVGRVGPKGRAEWTLQGAMLVLRLDS